MQSLGTIRFIGILEHSGAFKIGVELDTPTGLNNGTIRDITYFTPEHEDSSEGEYGVFVHQKKVTLLTPEEEDEMCVSPNDSIDLITADVDARNEELDDSGVLLSPNQTTTNSNNNNCYDNNTDSTTNNDVSEDNNDSRRPTQSTPTSLRASTSAGK